MENNNIYGSPFMTPLPEKLTLFIVNLSCIVIVLIKYSWCKSRLLFPKKEQFISTIKSSKGSC